MHPDAVHPVARLRTGLASSRKPSLTKHHELGLSLTMVPRQPGHFLGIITLNIRRYRKMAVIETLWEGDKGRGRGKENDRGNNAEIHCVCV
jgi:hypothetical protein